MPTSGTTAYTMTAAQMIKNALVEIGIVASGASPTSDEETDALTRLNSMLKSWQQQGVNLWREDEVSVTVTADTTPTTLDSDIRQVFGARYIGDDYERQLAQWEREDYLSLPNKDTEGEPTIFYVKRDRDALKLYVWPVPTEDSTIKLDCERIVETITATSETVDVPQHAYEAVWMNLAARLIPMFGSTEIAPATSQYVIGRAQQLFDMLMDDDRPQSIFIGPY